MLVTLLATLSIATAPMVRVSVEGNGYLQFAQDGHALYTSSAPLITVDGWLSNPNGAPLLPTLRVPEGTKRVDIDEDGNVFAVTNHFRGRVGRISLATFSPGADLRPYGSFLVSSATPKYKEPGDGDAGTIHVLNSSEPTPITPTPAPAPSEEVVVSRDDEFVQGWLNRRPEEPSPITTVRSGTAHIVVSSQSDINADQYALGDLAVIDADPALRQALISARIGDTPKPGKKIGVRRETILRQLQSQGFDTSDFQIEIPRRAYLARHGQQASGDTIRDMAVKAAEQVCGERDYKASLHMESDYAPEGAIGYEVESCTPTPKGAIVIVVTKIDGERYNSHVVRISTNG
jgi:hypothetical protein